MDGAVHPERYRHRAERRVTDDGAVEAEFLDSDRAAGDDREKKKQAIVQNSPGLIPDKTALGPFGEGSFGAIGRAVGGIRGRGHLAMCPGAEAGGKDRSGPESPERGAADGRSAGIRKPGPP